MKYLIYLIITVLLHGSTAGQEPSPLIQMVNAEKSFAAYAGSTGITEAFMKFLDDSAKVFERGQILNGKEVWRDRKMDSMQLKWYPEFADMAASGDFGYTTGPSEFRLKIGSKLPDHKGYFHSIWRKNSNGEWKVLLDMGTPSPQSVFDERKVEYVDREIIRKKEKVLDDIKKVEENFIANYADGKGYMKYGSPSARYYRPAHRVAKGAYPYSDTLKYTYKNAGTGIAASGDLAYAYGYVDVLGKTGNYLRVWKKDADMWRIVLDAASY